MNFHLPKVFVSCSITLSRLYLHVFLGFESRILLCHACYMWSNAWHMIKELGSSQGPRLYKRGMERVITLRWSDVAMGNGRFRILVLLETSIYRGFPSAMFYYWRVSKLLPKYVFVEVSWMMFPVHSERWCQYDFSWLRRITWYCIMGVEQFLSCLMHKTSQYILVNLFCGQKIPFHKFVPILQ